MLLQDTGMRIGECLDLTIDDFDFHHRQVTEEAYMDLTREEIEAKYNEHSPLGKWRLR
ncbi:site-specific integrase [Paenibacillus popilliae]|uniref:Integrase n=1 Tax=Paenibacillus popilliae ATCC 14706 TaxID=1212764 RepID=M9LQC2_PAEPP|nr:site-specific integrase [Paenibacillus popilliae]GAC43016.1 integrase [Paenibacillus popilliae ATCC 14706]